METHEKRGKAKEEALVLCFLCLCQPRATIMLVNRNIFIYLFFFGEEGNILESCLHFMPHRPEPVPRPGSWAQRRSHQTRRLTNETAASCPDGTPGEF